VKPWIENVVKKKSRDEDEQRRASGNEVGKAPVPKAAHLPSGNSIRMPDNNEHDAYRTKIVKRPQIHTQNSTNRYPRMEGERKSHGRVPGHDVPPAPEVLRAITQKNNIFREIETKRKKPAGEMRQETRAL
jgi:hypothetical protein